MSTDQNPQEMLEPVLARQARMPMRDGRRPCMMVGMCLAALLLAAGIESAMVAARQQNQALKAQVEALTVENARLAWELDRMSDYTTPLRLPSSMAVAAAVRGDVIPSSACNARLHARAVQIAARDRRRALRDERRAKVDAHRARLIKQRRQRRLR